MGCGGTDWIVLAQDRARWRVLLKAAMNHKMREIPWLAEDLLDSHDKLYSTELVSYLVILH